MFGSSVFIQCSPAGVCVRATAAEKRFVAGMDVLRVSLQITDDGERLQTQFTAVRFLPSVYPQVNCNTEQGAIEINSGYISRFIPIYGSVILIRFSEEGKRLTNYSLDATKFIKFSKPNYRDLTRFIKRYLSILFLNILTLLACTQSVDQLFHTLMILCENENFLTSNLLCFFTSV